MSDKVDLKTKMLLEIETYYNDKKVNSSKKKKIITVVNIYMNLITVSKHRKQKLTEMNKENGHNSNWRLQ